MFMNDCYYLPYAITETVLTHDFTLKMNAATNTAQSLLGVQYCMCLEIVSQDHIQDFLGTFGKEERS